jgi:hypothetical protein
MVKRDIAEGKDAYLLRESEESYGPVFDTQNRPIAPKKHAFWGCFAMNYSDLAWSDPCAPAP